MPKKEPRYISLTGHNYKPEGKDEEVRVEIGDDVSDMPEASLKREIKAGKVEEVQPTKGGK